MLHAIYSCAAFEARQLTSRSSLPYCLLQAANERACLEKVGDHPNVVKLIDIVEDENGVEALVLEFCEGGDLIKRMARRESGGQAEELDAFGMWNQVRRAKPSHHHDSRRIALTPLATSRIALMAPKLARLTAALRACRSSRASLFCIPAASRISISNLRTSSRRRRRPTRNALRDSNLYGHAPATSVPRSLACLGPFARHACMRLSTRRSNAHLGSRVVGAGVLTSALSFS